MRILAATIALLITCHLAAAQGVVSVTTEELNEYPHRYWAKSLVFRDVLEILPVDRTLTIKSQIYYEMETRELGKIYANREVRDLLENYPTGDEYIFGGTVLKKDTFSGLFSQGSLVVIVEKVIDQIEQSPDQIENEIRTMINIDSAILEHRAQKAMADLFSESQRSMLIYAKERGIEFEDLFDPTNDHSHKTLDLIRGNVVNLERDSELSPTELLAQFIHIVMSKEAGNVAEGLYTGPGSLDPLPTPDLAPREVVMRATLPDEFLSELGPLPDLSVSEATEVEPEAESTELAVVTEAPEMRFPDVMEQSTPENTISPDAEFLSEAEAELPPESEAVSPPEAVAEAEEDPDFSTVDEMLLDPEFAFDPEGEAGFDPEAGSDPEAIPHDGALHEATLRELEALEAALEEE